MKFDFVIVGAGIVGLTIARRILMLWPKVKVLILEKESSLGVHASGRNSGVLHTGIYYPAETLKAKFCRRGANALFNYAQENNIDVRKDGKVIVARSEDNARGLSKLMDNAKANGISAELLDEKCIRKIEPHAKSQWGGIYCKDTAVIDSVSVLHSLKKELSDRGVSIVLGEEVISIDDAVGKLTTNNHTYHYDQLINASGAFADKVAKMVGVGDEYKLVPFKGLYYKLSSEHAFRVKGSIYPVPDPELPFLGIHFTRVITGDVYIGPTAIPALGRENYSLLGGVSLGESASVLWHLSMLYMKNVQNFRRLVHKELPHLSKSGFLDSAALLIDELKPDWIEKTPKVGIRPQLINTKKNKLEMDFLLERGKKSLHVLNSISPAFTSSFAVADYIVNELDS
ncbi:L-2-hydroxyglutarate oxidase [Pleionea sp. CnH1-48]|uniref:L-2-hydroxyglutarate oxidase n=1 Tax=Pleionea sp. CnH1-48 TaxID=2954494 RepID=UPI002096D1D8|nr:L-2-hydroxyglutarate oxidase [Pleionea sp. CnH1-48]MCO7223804.1 L-2-hydroxyglutarate oxidase [Pleionea sp. CnH1-48]